MTQRKRELGEFNGVELKNGWKVLEALTDAKHASVAYYKEFWLKPAEKVRRKVIITAGEWNPRTSDQPNRFFVRGSNFTSDYSLFKYIKLESTEKKVMEIMEKTDKKFDALYKEWIEKYEFNPNRPEPENYEEPIWY